MIEHCCPPTELEVWGTQLGEADGFFFTILLVGSYRSFAKTPSLLPMRDCSLRRHCYCRTLRATYFDYYNTVILINHISRTFNRIRCPLTPLCPPEKHE
uniref:Uncharacterized protein n=1 Tax=Physcomitrium patens TaxID=3218 RepID=A0A2K1IZM1_PHYPA|nr:hypothetical protein PHYPA_022623 [Physcomitrium patens]